MGNKARSDASAPRSTTTTRTPAAPPQRRYWSRRRAKQNQAVAASASNLIGPEPKIIYRNTTGVLQRKAKKSRDISTFLCHLTKMRMPALDGLRAASILLVLAAHLLPLGPKSLSLNETAGLMGMAIFFALSGFLIVSFLANGMALSIFVLRRIARIVPLAWLAIAILYIVFGGPLLPNLAFYANLPPIQLMVGGGHLWSLCVEIQFYAFASLLGLMPTRKALIVIPALCVLVTTLRILNNVPVDIVTWYRVDEILSGGTIALFYAGWFGRMPKLILRRIPFSITILLLFVCSHFEALQYFRAYAAALVLGATIYNLQPWEERILVNKPARYIAEISYALYVIHGMLIPTWLGSGEVIEKYLKRPLLIFATFGLSHLSTFYFERPITRLARTVETRRQATED